MTYLAQYKFWGRITHRFGERRSEWFMSAYITLWGLVMLLTKDVFRQGEIWAAFERVFYSQHMLGWIMITLGLLRFGGLFVNGARATLTPAIRQISAAGGCLIWSGIAFCFAASGIVSTWIAIYPLFAVSELFNIYRAAHDQGATRNGKSY